MNGNTQADYQTRAIITGLVVVCATALLILGKLDSLQWIGIVSGFGGVYAAMKYSTDQKANGTSKVDSNSLIASIVRDLPAMTADIVVKTLKNGGQNDIGNKT
jgi:hypothetical protein